MRVALARGLERVCVWKMDACQTPRMWRYLGATLGPAVEGIEKVERVRQRDGRVRLICMWGRSGWMTLWRS
jgi:hypothetical protein